MIIGIDPGQKGGIAGLRKDGTPAFVMKMPMLAKIVDVVEVALLFDVKEPDLVVIERQVIMGQQRGAMAIGANYGRLMGQIEYAGVAHEEVSPTSWKNWLKIADASLTTKQRKELAYQRAVKVFGKRLDPFDVKPTQDGPVEALLIAYWGWATKYASYATRSFEEDVPDLSDS